MSIVKLMFLFTGIVSCIACARKTVGLNPGPADAPEARYFSTHFAPVPTENLNAVEAGPISAERVLPFEDVRKLSEPGYMDVENGYVLLKDDTVYVAARTDFPGAIKEMVYWWFWWQAQKDIRYRLWCPGDHYSTAVADMDRMADEKLSLQERCLNNPQYPVEDIGSGVEKLTIRFVPPESFGFDTAAFEEQGVAAVMCAVVGSRKLGFTVNHSCMVHLFRKKGDGLELRSRFWLGRKLPFLLRKLFINEKTASDMYFHCIKEYNHLAAFLPDLYYEFNPSAENDQN